MKDADVGTPLNVVILEDRWQDAVLMASALEEHGFSASWRCVSTEADFRDALRTPPDVILADYQLPGFDATDALAIVRETCPGTPFIVVTGALGDEAAAACIRDGATDYVLKDRLARLGNAVDAALEQRHLRQRHEATLDALIASERRFRSVFDDSPVGMVILASDLAVLEVNPAFRAMMGAGVSSIETSSFLELVVASDRPHAATVIERVRSSVGARSSFEVRMQYDDRPVVWARISVSVLAIREGSRDHLLAIVEDITERVRAEVASRSRDAILHAVGRGAELFLGDGPWAEVLETYLRLIGRSASLGSLSVVSGVSGPEMRLMGRWFAGKEGGASAPAALRAIPSLFTHIQRAARRLSASEAVVCPADPSHGLGALLQIPIAVRQKCWGCLAIEALETDRTFSDAELEALRTAADLLGDAIQDREAAEELRFSQERTRLIVETALDAVISIDGEGRITGWNTQAGKTFGWSFEEAVGRSLLELVAPESARSEWMRHGVGAQHEVSSGMGSSRFETVALRRDGTEFPAEVASSATHLDGTTLVGVFVRDLTAQKEAERELEEARRQDDAVAARIQEEMLRGDAPIETPRLSVSSDVVPGQVIAGDFLASVRHDEDTIDVVVGDVMGKGSNAALLGAITKGYIYQATRHLSARLREFNRLPAPHEVVAAVQAHVAQDLQKLDSFITMVYARFDLSGMQCTLVDCGHTRTIHYRSSTGQCELIQGDNLPLGVVEREFLVPLRVPFEPGDVFLFYSDGVIEAESPSEEQFGEERLIATIMEAETRSPASLIKSVMNAVTRFCDSPSPGDDVTCLAVAIGHAPPEKPHYQRALEVSGSLEALETVRSFVQDFCRKLPEPRLSGEAVDALMLAAHEAVCNVMQHAHQGRPDIPVQILAEAYDDRVELRVFDTGVGFNLDKVAPPRTDGSQESGYGVFLMKKLVDDVDYRRDELGRNYYWLVKWRRRPSESRQ
jgi:sigma-B regulation protein RsbU (phosphoserine phosphatase)